MDAEDFEEPRNQVSLNLNHSQILFSTWFLNDLRLVRQLPSTWLVHSHLHWVSKFCTWEQTKVGSMSVPRHCQSVANCKSDDQIVRLKHLLLLQICDLRFDKGFPFQLNLPLHPVQPLHRLRRGLKRLLTRMWTRRRPGRNLNLHLQFVQTYQCLEPNLKLRQLRISYSEHLLPGFCHLGRN